jgi:hypothetical protein
MAPFLIRPAIASYFVRIGIQRSELLEFSVKFVTHCYSNSIRVSRKIKQQSVTQEVSALAARPEVGILARAGHGTDGKRRLGAGDEDAENDFANDGQADHLVAVCEVIGTSDRQIRML